MKLPPPQRLLGFFRAALVLIVLVTFGRIVGFGPVNWDDRETIFANPLFRPVGGEAFVAAWERPQLSLWIPVTHTFWAILAMIGEGGPTSAGGGPTVSAVPFRVASLLLHASATLLCFEIVRRVARRTIWPALVAATMFAVHPIQVEAVAWISGQKDLLAAALTFAAIVAALEAAADPDRPVRRPLAFGALVLGVLAMLAKPQAVTIVATLPIVLRLAGVTWRRAVSFGVALAAPAVAVAIVAKLVQTAPLVDAVTPLGRLTVAVDALGFYVRQLLWPATLLVDYGRTPATVLDARHALVGGAIVLAVAAVALFARRRAPALGGGVLLAAVSIGPVLGLVPFEFQLYSTVSDHYLYPAMLGVAIALAAVLERAPPRVAFVVAIVVAVGLGALSARQVGVWRTTATLFEHTLAHRPTSLAATRVLATDAAERGDDGRAIELLRLTTSAHPRDGLAWFNLANALARSGDLRAALAASDEAARYRPGSLAVRHNRGVLLVRLGDLPAAAREFEAAVGIDGRAEASRRALAAVRARLNSPSTSPAGP